MKHFFGILFLLFLLAPSLATYGWLRLHKNQARKAAKAHIMARTSPEEWVRLQFPDAQARAELRWEHAGEFEYQGQMYDIVETQIKGDTAIYLCWPDHVETRLNRQLKQLVAQILGSSPDKREQQKRLFDYYQSLFCVHMPLWLEILPLPRQANPFQARHYCHPEYAPPVPPPRLC